MKLANILPAFGRQSVLKQKVDENEIENLSVKTIPAMSPNIPVPEAPEVDFFALALAVNKIYIKIWRQNQEFYT